MFNKKNTQKSDPDRIQTYNLLIRSQMLYSVELPGRSMIAHTPRQSGDRQEVTRIGFKPITF